MANKPKMPGTLLSALRRPYPHQPNRWVILVLLPLFISLFLVTFQPFGLHGFSHEYKHLLLIGFGGVTLVMLALNMYLMPWILPKFYREENWTVGREMIFLIVVVLTISVGNYFYSVIFGIAQWVGLYGLIVFVGFTFAIAVVPIILILSYSHNQMLKRHLESAGRVSQFLPDPEKARTSDTSFRISSENSQHEITARTGQVICIESEGNYVAVHIAKEGSIVRETLRNTMKSIEDQLGEMDVFFRCHRAFMVNLEQIEKVEGNSQGYRITLRYLDQQVPVSRSYIRRFQEALEKGAR